MQTLIAILIAAAIFGAIAWLISIASFIDQRIRVGASWLVVVLFFIWLLRILMSSSAIHLGSLGGK